MVLVIEGAELLVYDKDGSNFAIELSPTQLIAICKILGLQIMAGDKQYSCFSDESLKVIMEKTIDKIISLEDC